MKTKAAIILATLLTLPALANIKDCQEGSLFKRYSRFNGKRLLGNCHIEMHLCEKRPDRPSLPFYMEEALKENADFWVGDILVKDLNTKRSLYVPVYSIESKFPNTWIWIDEGRKSETYHYQDRNYDPASGLKEVIEIEFSKTKDRIDFLMKNSRESGRTPLRSLFFPNLNIVCESFT